MATYTIHTDGGSRGNPGEAAVGVVFEGEKTGHKEYGESIGIASNNVAEYQAVIFALKKLKHLIGSKTAETSFVDVHMDSELLVNQLNGKFKIKDADMQPLFLEVWNLRIDFGGVSFHHVRREKNKGADTLVNRVLDREESKLAL